MLYLSCPFLVILIILEMIVAAASSSADMLAPS